MLHELHIIQWEMSISLFDQVSSSLVDGIGRKDTPSATVPKGAQYTAIGSSSSSLPSCRTANSTKIKFCISPSGPPTQSNGIDKDSCHTGLNPLFLTTRVRRETRRDVEVEDIGLAASISDLYL